MSRIVLKSGLEIQVELSPVDAREAIEGLESEGHAWGFSELTDVDEFLHRYRDGSTAASRVTPCCPTRWPSDPPRRRPRARGPGDRDRTRSRRGHPRLRASLADPSEEPAVEVADRILGEVAIGWGVAL